MSEEGRFAKVVFLGPHENRGSPHWHPAIQACLYQNAGGMWLKYGA